MSFLKESLRTFASRILLVLANLPISILIARHLGAEGPGIYTSVTTYATTAVVIGLLGIDASHTYYLASRQYRSAQILGNAVVALGVISLILIPIFPPLLSAATRGEGDGLAPFLRIGAGMVPILSARYLLLSVFMARRRIEVFNLFYVAGNLLLLALLLIGFFIFGAGPAWTLWAFLASQGFMVLAAGRWVWVREMPSPRRLRFSVPLLRESLSYGLRGFLPTLLTTFVYRFDTVLVVRWLGVAAQGYYMVAVLLAEKLTHITASVQAVLFPHVAAAPKDEADRLTPLVCRHTLFWVICVAAALFALSPILIRLLYSRTFAPSGAPLRILLPGIAALTISKLLTADLSGRNKRFFPTVIMAAALGVNLGLNVLWTRSLGIRGAAWASTVAYATQAFLMLLYYWRVTGLSPACILLPDREDARAYRRLIGRIAGRDRGTR